jgi:hypothetical protein
LGAGVSLASGLISAIGSIYQGQTTASALDAQANLADQNAAEAEAQGRYNAMKEQMLAGIKIGSISANYGASGVRSNSGSAEAVIAASTSNSELDRLNILHGADVRSIMYQNQASMDRVGATSALTGSTFAAVGSLAKAGMTAAAFGIAGSPPATQVPGLDGSKNLQQPQLGSQFSSSTYATDTLEGARQYMYDYPNLDESTSFNNSYLNLNPAASYGN